MEMRRKYQNRAHHGAYTAGRKAFKDGKHRKPPYGIDSAEALAFRRAWCDGYDDAKAASKHPPKPAAVRTCRVCGCTDISACESGCWWVADDLCSNCSGPPPRRANTFNHVRRAA